MKRFLPVTLTARTTLGILASMALVGGAFIWASALITKTRIEKQAIDGLRERLEIVGNTVSIACFTEDDVLAKEVGEGLLKSREIAAVTIRSGSQTLASLSRGGTDSAIGADLPPGMVLHREVPSPFDPQEIVGAIALTLNPAEVAARLKDGMRFSSVLLTLQLMLLGGGAAVLVVVLTVRPIKAISDQLHGMEVGSGRAIHPPERHERDEIGRLVEDINALSARLVSALREEQHIRQRIELGERKFHAIFDNAEAGIFIADGDGRITSCNTAFRALTSLPAVEEPVGQPRELPVLPWKDPEHVRTLLARCLEQGESQSDAVELRLGEDSRRWLHLRMTAIAARQVQGVLTDVTALMEARDQAEAANRAKTLFLSSMSHELRTPLNSIIGFAQLLEIGTLGPLADTQQDVVSQMLASGRHLLGLVNELLDLARIEAGRIDLTIETLAPLPMLEEAVTLMQPQIAERRISVHLHCTSDWALRADRARMRQVLLNLLSNAVKYNREGGRITLDCRLRDDRLSIAVSDEGPGIPAERQSEVFQPFQRLDAERGTIEGTGIGLVISKRLVEAMHGRIGFSSEPGRGSRFWIELPAVGVLESASAVDAAVVPAGETKDAPSMSKRVLYVEDNPLNLNVMKHIIELLPGVELLNEQDGESALRRLREEPVDLVLMDIDLPGIDGLSALQQMRAEPTLAAIPAIAVTAVATPKDVEQGLAAGFLAYHAKPFDVPVLLEEIRETLASVEYSC